MGKKVAIINGNKFYTVENLFEGIREREKEITEENKRIAEEAFHRAAERGRELLMDPEIVREAANAKQVESRAVTDETIEEIVRDMEAGMVVEEVEYEDRETIVHEEGIEEVIYVGGKTQSIYTPRKDNKKAWRVFWRRIKSIKEEEDAEVDVTKGQLDQEAVMFGTDDYAADQPMEETPNSNKQGWGGDSLGSRGWEREEEQRGREEGRGMTPQPRRVTSGGSPTPRKKKESGAKKAKRRATSTIIGTAANTIAKVQIRPALDWDDATDDEHQMKEPTEEELRSFEEEMAYFRAPTGGTNISKHSDVDCDMVGAPAPDAPAATLNASKHAPADLTQKETAKDLAIRVAREDEDEKEGYKNSMEGVVLEEGEQAQKPESIDKWETLLGKGWNEGEREVQIERWLSFMATMARDAKAVKDGRTGGGEWAMGKSRRKKLEKKCMSIVRKIGQAIEFVDKTESMKGGGWKRAERAGRDIPAWRVWVEEEERDKEESVSRTTKRMEKTVAVIAAQVGCAGPKEQKAAAEVRKEREEERKTEEKKRKKDQGSSRSAKEMERQKEKEKTEEKEWQKAVAAEAARTNEMKALDGQIQKCAERMAENRDGEEEKEALRREMSELVKKREEVEARKLRYEGTTFEAVTGTPEVRWGKVVVITTHVDLKGGNEDKIKQARVIQGKINDLLREKRGVDGQPYAHIKEVKVGGMWGDPNEIRWLLAGVHREERKDDITAVMYEQMEVVCEQVGVGLSRLFVNELNAASVVLQGVKGSMGEGAELLHKLRSENEGIKITPRWPLRIGASKLRVEVKSVQEVERLVRAGSVRIGGKELGVVHYEPPKPPRLPPANAPKAPRQMAATPAQNMGSFAAVAGTANAGYKQGEGWTTVKGAKNVGGTCRKCARTGHLERACPIRLKTSQFSCHGCGKFGHFINACPARGTGIFAPRGCFNCGKRDHQDDQCPSPKKDTRGQKRGGGALVNPRPKQPPMREGFINSDMNSQFRPGRLSETSGATVASESAAEGTSAPPPTATLAPRVPEPC